MFEINGVLEIMHSQAELGNEGLLLSEENAFITKWLYPQSPALLQSIAANAPYL